MKKSVFLSFLFVFTSVANAQSIGDGIDMPAPPPPAEITPEERWITGKNWRNNVEYSAENYRPERLKELARAIEFIDKRRANASLGSGESKTFDYEQKNVDVSNPNSVKEFINQKLKTSHDEAVYNAGVLKTGIVNVQ